LLDLYDIIIFMLRDAYNQLLQWKNSPRQKPLLVQGARQVGKTWLLKNFGQAEYEDVCYLNFEEVEAYKNFFTNTLDPQQILRNISVYIGKEITPNKTLLIFDEIQECPEAITSLKYFSEQASQYPIVAAGSLLGVKLSEKKAFPVGKVNFLDLYPLTFFEFLQASGQTELRNYLEKDIINTTPLPEPIHQKLIELLRTYMYTGGMPEAVKHYAETQNFQEVREIQIEILKAYSLDFAKHAPTIQTMRISAIWESIPKHLAKENKKFVFSAIKKSARGREYEIAIQWLLDAGLIYKSHNITKPHLPLEGYTDHQAFKIFLLDTGLLAAMCQLAPQTLLHGDEIFTEYKGALSENLVAQELVPVQNKKLYYWTSEGKAEVDFIVSDQSQVLPLEVKYGTSQKKKSLLVYEDKYKPKLLLRTSSMNLKKDGKICNLPLYFISRFDLAISIGSKE
jgi:uncharacterized protein